MGGGRLFFKTKLSTAGKVIFEQVMIYSRYGKVFEKFAENGE